MGVTYPLQYVVVDSHYVVKNNAVTGYRLSVLAPDFALKSQRHALG